MKSFETLIRLRKHELDVARRALSSLETRADEIESRRIALEAEYAAETARARGNVEASFVIGEYIIATRQRRHGIDREMNALAQEIARAEAEVRDAFRELKRFELAAQQESDRVARQEQKRDQSLLDEVALNGFRRDQKVQA
ncbi:MAG: flagellar FliJ family protein [Alphaproteobacteria bacterium]|nr:flagellar FliJ family protein [Alphaproteobacteria bacterium]